MSTGAAVVATIVLVFVAGVTAGFWLSLLMWIPMVLLGQMQDEEAAFAIVAMLTMAVATLAVFLFGLLVVGLPWPAAAIAGGLVGITSYTRRAPDPYDDFGYVGGYDTDYVAPVAGYDTRLSEPTYREKPFPCPTCGKGLATQNGLDQHVAARHGPGAASGTQLNVADE